jgi:hypothetical protein
MAEEFNNFFSSTGTNISNSHATTLEPDDFIPHNPRPFELELGPTSPMAVYNINKLFESKTSMDTES